MKVSAIAVAAIAIRLLAGPADAQVQERTIRWGHLNNPDHPVSLGVQKFAEILAAKSGGKLKVREFRRVAARQRDADAIGAARRHAGNDVGGDHIARERREGIRASGLPFHRQHRRQADALVSGTVRASHDSTRLPEKDLIGLATGAWDSGTPPTAAGRSPRSKTSRD